MSATTCPKCHRFGPLCDCPPMGAPCDYPPAKPEPCPQCHVGQWNGRECDTCGYRREADVVEPRAEAKGESAEWPEKCPLTGPLAKLDGPPFERGYYAAIESPHDLGAVFVFGSINRESAEKSLDEIRRRWRLAPAAKALSNAVDAYLKARHNMTGPLDEKLIVAQVNLLNAQQAYEQAAR